MIKKLKGIILIMVLMLTACNGPGAQLESAVQASPTAVASEGGSALPSIEEFPVPAGSRPHDVAPAPDGSVWYTAQGSGELGRLDPASGETHHIALGAGSAPHGVIVGPDGAPWITDGGLNAIVRVDPETEEVQLFPLPEGSGYANLNTATFDANNILWFTGQSGVYGRVDPAVGNVEVFAAPRGRGPYGIATTPAGQVYYASLAGSHIARLDLASGEATVLEPPTPGQGARRVWPDSQGRIWVSEWNSGQLALYDPATDSWREWPLPGAGPRPYAVYVDDQDIVWLSDFGANAMVSFDPTQETFQVYELPSAGANVRQILGRPGEVWGAESGTDKLVVIRTGSDLMNTILSGDEVAKIARFLHQGRESYGIVADDMTVQRIEGDLFDQPALTDEQIPLAEVQLLAPARPSKIIGVGLNYESHAGLSAAETPGLFAKFANALAGPDDPIWLYPDSENLHFEGELVVVIGKTAQNIAVDEVSDYILGVTAGNDVTERDWQSSDLQWLRAKSSDSFSPVGPYLVTGLNYNDLLVETRLNGETLQSESSAGLIHNVDEIVSYVSRYITLYPGDLIFTGTPGTTQAMQVGDVVEVEVAGIGILRNTVRERIP